MAIEEHTKRRQIELGIALEPRTPIYLDTKYWLLLRDADSGRRGPVEAELLQRLRNVVAQGLAFCPISEAVFVELLKQNDARSRLHSARIIDELSLGVALIPGNVRMATELAHFLQSHAPDGRSDLHPLHHLVWSKSTYALGYLFPSLPGLDPATELSVQKAFFDHVWGMSLADVVEKLDGAMPPDHTEFDGLAASLNREVARHSENLTSFRKAYDDELAGAVDVCGDMVMDIVNDMARRARVEPPARGSPQWNETQRLWKNLLYLAVKKGPSQDELRSIHVAAALHAAIRWNKGRRFKPNDFCDLEHAGAALAHCRAFFTEKSLCQLVTARHVALDRLFECHVVAEPKDAIDYVGRLAH